MSAIAIATVDAVHEWWDVLASDFTADELCDASDHALYAEVWFFFINLVICITYIA